MKLIEKVREILAQTAHGGHGRSLYGAP